MSKKERKSVIPEDAKLVINPDPVLIIEDKKLDNWDNIADDVINKELELEKFILNLRFAKCSSEVKEQIKKEIRKRMYNE